MSIKDSLERINSDLAQLPPESKGAMIITGSNKGLTFSIATKLDNGWKISANVEQKLSKTKPDVYVGIGKVW